MTGLLLKWVKKLSENECICTPSKFRVNEKLALATACVFNRVQPVHRLLTGFGANARTASYRNANLNRIFPGCVGSRILRGEVADFS
jgi:hypothetical protein